MRLVNFSSFAAIGLLLGANIGSAANVDVTAAYDEDNNNTSGANAQSHGCSLREAIISYNNAAAYNDCTVSGSGNIDTITIASDMSGVVAGDFTHRIPVNSPVDDPTMPMGMGTVRHGPLPTIHGVDGTHSPLTIQASAGNDFYIGCDEPPNGAHIITLGGSAEVTIDHAVFQHCTTGGDGIAINSSVGKAYLTLTNVAFKDIHSDNAGTGGKGGAVYFFGGSDLTRGGRLSMTSVTFGGTGATPSAADGCSTGAPGGSGNGGALAIENIGNSSSDGTPSGSTVLNPVVLNGVSFDHNTAEGNGGAVWINNGTSTAKGFNIQFLNTNYTNNAANADSTGNANNGGGAVWATTTATDMTTTSPEVFLIQGSLTGSQFLANTATEGNGGAILLAAGRLTYSDPAAPTAGGVVGVNFSGNTAGGDGGAIYSRGALSIIESSFAPSAAPFLQPGNSSTGSGGAIALNGTASGSLLTPTTIANVTFTGNTATANGAAIANLQSGLQAVNAIRLINDTIDSNTANGTPGGSMHNLAPSASLLASNTVFSNGTGGNCTGNAPTDSTPTHNRQFNPNTGCGAITAGDPLLGSPSVFGGPNLFIATMQPATGSDLLGTGDQTVCTAGPILNTDATGRSAIRPSGSPNCDIGAFESGTLPVSLQSFSVD